MSPDLLKRVVKIGIVVAVALGLLAAGASWWMRRRASVAQQAISDGKIKDAQERGTEAPARERLREIQKQLRQPEPPLPATPTGRTYDEVLAEQRRRGQVIE